LPRGGAARYDSAALLCRLSANGRIKKDAQSYASGSNSAG
jgi:hypothetical protein